MSNEINENSDPVTVVISVYNEAETIEDEIRNIYKAIVSRLPGSEFIVAEDGSTDGTKEIILKLVNELGIVHSTSNERKGYAKALRDAFKLAKCPYVFFSDTGNKHNPEEFWKLYGFCKDYGLVLGWKKGRNDQLYRQMLTWFYNKILGFYFKVKIRDADSGFRIYRRDIVRKVFNEDWLNTNLVASEIALRVMYSGFSVKEVPVSYQQRVGPSRGLPLRKIPRVIVGVLKNFPKLKKVLSNADYKKHAIL